MTIFHKLGCYEIVREIGHGGMAPVFLATDSRTGREVALKVVPHGTDREAREILEAEQWGAELQSQFSQVSDHVPTVHEHKPDHSGYFLVAMEYVDGENLSDVITRGGLDVERAVSIAIELCRFLESAHRFEAVIEGRQMRSLIHGDLKPRNIRITSQSKVKVLDFGIAKALSLSRKVTRNDFGTIPYLSPERLESSEVNEYTDLWACGVMLYEMVSGTPPFVAQDTRRLERLILSRLPRPSLHGRCPIGLEAIVAKLLGPTPADRYASAQMVREDLERFRSGNTTQAENEGWPHHTVDEEPTRRTRPASDIADEEKTRRTRTPGDQTANASVGSAQTPTEQAKAAAPKTGPVRPNKPRRVLRAALILIVLGIISNEIWVARAAGQLAKAVSTRELEQLAEMWSEYDSLSRRSYLRIGTITLERSLARRTSSLAERVIANYRTRLPTVREAQWQMARDSLVRAIAVADNDRHLRAAFRYCEGHLHRINGEARKDRRENVEAQRQLTAAVAAFREAAELRPGWPDPFLGLARVFIYGLEDVDRAAGRAERGATTRVLTNRTRNGPARRWVSHARQHSDA